MGMAGVMGTAWEPGPLTLQRLLGLEQGPALGLQLLVAGVELGQPLLQLEDAALQPLLLRPAETPPAVLPKPGIREWEDTLTPPASTHLSPSASWARSWPWRWAAASWTARLAPSLTSPSRARLSRSNSPRSRSCSPRACASASPAALCSCTACRGAGRRRHPHRPVTPPSLPVAPCIHHGPPS